MVRLTPSRSPYPLLYSSTKPFFSPTTLDLKNLIPTLFLPYLRRISRYLSKAKSLLLHLLHDTHLLLHLKNITKSKNKKALFGSVRLHRTWPSSSSSHVLPFPSPVTEGISVDHLCGGCTSEEKEAAQLSSYLQWLEEKGGGQEGEGEEECVMMNEIDKLADMFIRSCHEKFLLEKIESYRIYQEMLARSM